MELIQYINNLPADQPERSLSLLKRIRPADDTERIEWLVVAERLARLAGRMVEADRYLSMVPNRLDVFDEFDIHIVYINLNRRTDRRIQIDAELERLAIRRSRIHRLPATAYPTFGALGCSLSHIRALTMSLQNNWPFVIILEDDFDFHPDADIVRRNLLSFLRQRSTGFGFDCAVLTACVPNLRVSTENETGTDVAVRLIESTSAAGYLLPAAYVPILLACFESSVMPLATTGRHWLYAIDRAWSDLQRRDRWFAFRPLLGQPRVSASDT